MDVETQLPSLPCHFDGFLSYLEAARTPEDIVAKAQPFVEYEGKLRRIFAQEPAHESIARNHLVPLYNDGKVDVNLRAREIDREDAVEKDRFLLATSDEDRLSAGSPAIVRTYKDFKKNFRVFSESALAELNWDNVIAAGSSVVTALLPVPARHNKSTRALRTYYHEKLAPASDVDLFLYGLNEAQAIEKIKQIETCIRDTILSETTVVRTKHAITICSEYPFRHIQIVLRLYKSVTEILTGFDVDCSCVAYDGFQVWASPRALRAYATRVNRIDLTRRSPSYENRLSKYAHRGFEVYWPLLDRTRIDPTIFERNFTRVQGLARLLVLEKLPHPQDRDQYMNKRRKERGRPDLPYDARFRHQLPGNIKNAQPDDVAEWVEEEEVANYHTFTIPWGPKYGPKKIERLLYSKDLLLNAEWNKAKDRKVDLHRHPAFFGRVEDVVQDCCGYCPTPITDEDLAIHEAESKRFVSGKVTFLEDDPGRQEIGSFHPLTDDDWTGMAYVGNTARLCQAIVDQDLEGVEDWFETSEGADLNQRDHTGRTPLHLAVMTSTPEIVQYLVDHRARIVSRLYNGFTALHLAAHRGDTAIVRILLDKSTENEAIENEKEGARKVARRDAAHKEAEEEHRVTQIEKNIEFEDHDIDMLSDVDSNEDDGGDNMTQGSFVKIKTDDRAQPSIEDSEEEPDFYDVDVVAWDSPVSALHLAIIGGHLDVISVLIDGFASDVLLPVKIMDHNTPRQPRAAILSLLLPLDLEMDQINNTIKTLLDHGASPLQSDMHHITSVHYLVSIAKVEIVKKMQALRGDAVCSAIKYLKFETSLWTGARPDNCLLAAIRSGRVEMVEEVLALSAEPQIVFEPWLEGYRAASTHRLSDDVEDLRKTWRTNCVQPIILAAKREDMVDIVRMLIDLGADVNTLSPEGWNEIEQQRYTNDDNTLLDIISQHKTRLSEYLNNLKVSVEDDPENTDIEVLKDEQYYLQGLQPGSYKYWSANIALKHARHIQSQRQKDRDLKLAARLNVDEQLIEKKRRAISELLEKYKILYQLLVDKGAKTYQEMHPNLKKEDYRYYSWNDRQKHDYSAEDYAFQPSFKFYGTDVKPSNYDRYVELFDACLVGNIEEVRSLCIHEHSEKKPLEISVRDENGFTPFSLAVCKGDYELADLVLDIAAAQYGQRKDTKYTHYSVAEEDGSDDDAMSNERSASSRPVFSKNLIEGEFTIDDIDALAKSVKSSTTPGSLLSSACEIWAMLDGEINEAQEIMLPHGRLNTRPVIYHNETDKPWAVFNACMRDERSRNSSTLWKYAVIKNDLLMEQYLLRTELKYATQDEDEVHAYLQGQQVNFYLALNLGHLEIAAELVKQRGVLLGLDKLAEKSGVELKEKPKHYQGLSVYGSKRKDWAREGREVRHIDMSPKGTPLLNAIMFGTVSIISRFISDEPMQWYGDFLKLFANDQRVKALSAAEDGTSKLLAKWIAQHKHLVLHIAVLSWPAGQLKLIRKLLSRFSDILLEKKSSHGMTPLLLAMDIANYPAFKLLIECQADQSARNDLGENLMHLLYARTSANHLSLLKYLVSLMDKRNIPKLLIERTSVDNGMQTPLHAYLCSRLAPDEPLCNNIKVLEYMLSLSSGKDLYIMDGGGDFPIHSLVRDSERDEITLWLAQRYPELLGQENATGMTVLEIMETQYLQNKIDNPPTIDDNPSHYRQSIVDYPLSDFSDGPRQTAKYAYDRLFPRRDTLYSRLKAIADAAGQKRMLISLLNANEVAKRLAIEQEVKGRQYRVREAKGLSFGQANRYDRDGVDGSSSGSEQEVHGDKQDEVELWKEKGQDRIERVPWLDHWDYETDDHEEELMRRWRKMEDFMQGIAKEISCCDLVGKDRDEHQHLVNRKDHRTMTTKIDEPEWWTSR